MCVMCVMCCVMCYVCVVCVCCVCVLCVCCVCVVCVELYDGKWQVIRQKFANGCTKMKRKIGMASLWKKCVSADTEAETQT